MSSNFLFPFSLVDKLHTDSDSGLFFVPTPHNIAFKWGGAGRTPFGLSTSTCCFSIGLLLVLSLTKNIYQYKISTNKHKIKQTKRKL